MNWLLGDLVGKLLDKLADSFWDWKFARDRKKQEHRRNETRQSRKRPRKFR